MALALHHDRLMQPKFILFLTLISLSAAANAEAAQCPANIVDKGTYIVSNDPAVINDPSITVDFNHPYDCANCVPSANKTCMIYGGTYYKPAQAPGNSTPILNIVTNESGIVRAGLTFECKEGYTCILDGDSNGDGVADTNIGIRAYRDWVIKGHHTQNTEKNFILQNFVHDAVTCIPSRQLMGVEDVWIKNVGQNAISCLNTGGWVKKNRMENIGGFGVLTGELPYGVIPIVEVSNNLILNIAGSHGINGGNVTARHNTIIGNNQENAGTGILAKYAYNNIVSNFQTCINASTSSSGNMVNNCHNNSYAGVSGNSGNYDIVDTPIFAPGNYYLTTTSPGVASGVPGEAFDQESIARNSQTPNRGALETTIQINDPPVALITELSETAGENFPLQMNGTCNDPQSDDQLTGVWTQTVGPECTSMTQPSITGNEQPILLSNSCTPPDVGTNTSLTFQLTCTDQLGLSHSVTKTVLLDAAPSARNITVETDEDVPVNVTLVGNDASDAVLNYVTISEPENGTLSGTAPNITYTPAINFFGNDFFNYEVTDSLGQKDTAKVSIVVASVNDIPVANAGPDQSITPLATVTLDGSLSSDPEGDPLTYTWRQIDGAVTTISDDNTAIATLSPIKVGVSIFELTVSDGESSATDTVTVTVLNASPVVTVDEDRHADPNTEISVACSATDANQDNITYNWSRVGNSPVVTNFTTDNNRLTMLVPLNSGEQRIDWKCTATDENGASDSKIVGITINSVAPNAYAGEDITVNDNTEVTLTCLGTDANGGPLAYVWEQIRGDDVNLSITNNIATFTSGNESGSLEFACMVTDGEGNSDVDEVGVMVTKRSGTGNGNARVTPPTDPTESRERVVIAPQSEVEQPTEIKNNPASETIPIEADFANYMQTGGACTLIIPVE